MNFSDDLLMFSMKILKSRRKPASVANITAILSRTSPSPNKYWKMGAKYRYPGWR